MDQEVECLLYKYEALNSKPSPTRKGRKGERERERREIIRLHCSEKQKWSYVVIRSLWRRVAQVGVPA
jgi:hypothetical protein